MVRDDKRDGCGISPFITGKDDPFFDACHWHDNAYTNNSWHEKNVDRHLVDLQFYRQMLQIAGDNLLLRARAWVYYKIARAFGCRYWEDLNPS